MRAFTLFLVPILLFSCETDKEISTKHLFEITMQNVGLITDSTQIKDLKFIFENDSLVHFQEDDSFVDGINFIDVYEKNGAPLLSIFPTDAHDSTATIDYVILKDSRYKTDKNISNESYYLDIRKAYQISEIINEMNAIKIEVHEIGAKFVIAKKDLQRNFAFGIEIDSTQIPDSTKVREFVKYF